MDIQGGFAQSAEPIVIGIDGNIVFAAPVLDGLTAILAGLYDRSPVLHTYLYDLIHLRHLRSSCENCENFTQVLQVYKVVWFRSIVSKIDDDEQVPVIYHLLMNKCLLYIILLRNTPKQILHLNVLLGGNISFQAPEILFLTAPP